MENHIYEYGEQDCYDLTYCEEVDRIGDYSGEELAYSDKAFTWFIYLSHEGTITFAGDIVPIAKEILVDVKEHWNQWV